MDQLDDLIQYENENTRLDFEASQYNSKQHEALLKDLMAMVNTSVSGTQYIVTGVKHQPNGSRGFISIYEQAIL